MPIGTQTPGSPTTITPDADPQEYTSFQGPAPDAFLTASDLYQIIQAVLNVQNGGANRPVLASIAALKALTDITPPLRYVRGFGWYQYESSFVFSDDAPPWFYASNTLSGAWVRCDWAGLLNDDSARRRINPALVPQALAAWGNANLTNPVTHPTVSMSAESVGIGTTISDLLPGDWLHLNAGPFLCEANTSTDFYLQFRITDGSNDTYSIPAKVKQTHANSVNLDFQYAMAADATGDCSVNVYCYGGGSVEAAIGQWLRWQVMRPLANL